MKSGITTAPTQYFHGHTNLFHELTSVDYTQSNEGSWDVTVFLQVPVTVQAEQFQCWCEMKSDQTTVLIECFHGHTNVSCPYKGHWHISSEVSTITPCCVQATQF